MSAAKKIAEAEELVRQAEKSLKTSLLKWVPDYDSAADEYSKAATAYRIGKNFDKSKECQLKAIECYKNNKSWFHAAKAYEQIVLLSKDTDKLLEIEEYVNKACSLYQQHGSPEAAASALDKAAKLTEQKHPELALRFYQHAIEVIMIEDSTRQATEYSSKVSRILVKLRRYDEATQAIKREIGLNQQTESYGQIGRLVVALVLVQLARGDSVEAEKAFREWGTCCEPEEVSTLQTLLNAFDEEDAEMAARMLATPFIRHMDVEYAILAKNIPLPEGMHLEKKSEDNAGNATNEDEDEGIC
ncbi:gamma-soluble NSF attachment protein [Drosophila guanche]|uniref:Gamma-soluble NSF attachment protein n=1 Tax=Drosophila guanche TaxID=7266 RepID=A0A3B0JDB7_DROGU|nr:gamma-soluble NSF attachment protein [Drosophila guanche]SPP73220.1 blast:Gamma-soluble NSF attachment protein [Drosophila guanche]